MWVCERFQRLAYAGYRAKKVYVLSWSCGHWYVFGSSGALPILETAETAIFISFCYSCQDVASLAFHYFSGTLYFQFPHVPLLSYAVSPSNVRQHLYSIVICRVKSGQAAVQLHQRARADNVTPSWDLCCLSCLSCSLPYPSFLPVSVSIHLEQPPHHVCASQSRSTFWWHLITHLCRSALAPSLLTSHFGSFLAAGTIYKSFSYYLLFSQKLSPARELFTASFPHN